MTQKKMPPVPPANRNPKDPENDPQPTPPQKTKDQGNATQRGQQENIRQNTHNQGNPQSR